MYSIDIYRSDNAILTLRCSKCHKIVPRDHVLPNKPLAHCPDCGFIFEPLELLRKLEGDYKPVKKSRLRICRDADLLEIVQKPLQTGIPLWTFLLVLLFDIGMVALYLYVKQLFPDENVFHFFRAQHNPDVCVGDRILTSLIVSHVFLLALPLWAFFDWRRIRIDRETLEITGRWLFIPWRKTVSRLQTKKASFNEWLVSF
ncbi:MAG: hypothetical protein FWE67_09270, partial [Planctomycetaceae bacterium]|nr:hypothetical protein [Planctomycetaceae bacterium]